MRALIKTLVLMEVVICFGPALLAFTMGLVVIPVAVASVFNGHVYGVYLLATLAGGAFGLLGMLGLVLKVLEPESCTLSPRKIKIFSGMGVSAVLGSLAMTSEGGYSWQAVIFAMPIVATIHLLYMARSYVFSSSRCTVGQQAGLGLHCGAFCASAPTGLHGVNKKQGEPKYGKNDNK